MDSLRLWSLAENLGSMESLVSHSVTMTHADVEEAERKRVGITDGLVLLSVSLEDGEDLIQELKQALKKGVNHYPGPPVEDAKPILELIGTQRTGRPRLPTPRVDFDELQPGLVHALSRLERPAVTARTN
jgi:hypothetical protein